MSASPHVFDVGAADFAERVIEASRRVPVLVDFWAEWCGPCRSLGPVLERVVEDLGGGVLLAKVDTDREQELAGHFGIRSLPTVMLFKDGGVVDQFTGAQPEGAVRAMLEPHVARASDAVLEAVEPLLAAGRFEDAAAALREALAADPDHDRLAPALARALLGAGELDAAQAALRELPPGRRSDPDCQRVAASIEFARVAADAPPTETLERAVAADPRDSASRHRLAARRVATGDYRGAMDELLEIVTRDRGYGDDAGRKALLGVFDIVGPDDPLVDEYRGRMARAMY